MLLRLHDPGRYAPEGSRTPYRPRGRLGSVSAFGDVVLEADRANAVVFGNLDAANGSAERPATD